MLLKQSIINFIIKHDVVINYSSLSFKGSQKERIVFFHLKDSFNSLPTGLAAQKITQIVWREFLDRKKRRSVN